MTPSKRTYSYSDRNALPHSDTAQPTDGTKHKAPHKEHRAPRSYDGSVPASGKRVPLLGAPKRHHSLQARDLYPTPGPPDADEALWPRTWRRLHCHWALSQGRRMGDRIIADPGGHPHHLPLACLGDPKAPRTDSTNGPMKGVPPGPAILRAAPGCTLWGELPKHLVGLYTRRRSAHTSKAGRTHSDAPTVAVSQ